MKFSVIYKVEYNYFNNSDPLAAAKGLIVRLV